MSVCLPIYLFIFKNNQYAVRFKSLGFGTQIRLGGVPAVPFTCYVTFNK